jgi:hypothetical protein
MYICTDIHVRFVHSSNRISNVDLRFPNTVTVGARDLISRYVYALGVIRCVYVLSIAHMYVCMYA